jgi:hypothetical protein
LEFNSGVQNLSFCYQNLTVFQNYNSYPILYGNLKVKGIPQGIPTTSFVKEVPKTLPPTQETYLALCKQQLVKEFPESKFPLPSETTQFHVSIKELEHPVPIHNMTSPKSLKPESSPSTQANDLVLAIKKLGKMKSDTGKLCEPELFTRKDPKKLKAFISNVNYISAIQILIVILRRLPLHCPTFGMLLRNGLNPIFPDLQMSLQNNLITGKLSWINSVPISNLTMKLVMPNMN